LKTVLHQDWSCAPDGHTTYHFKAGDVLECKAAAMALADGVGFNPVEETKVLPVMETKKGRRK
jgi:hypothetical protein